MNIADQLLKEHSKSNTQKIAKYISEDKQRYGQLWTILEDGKELLKQRAAWVVITHFEEFPLMFIPYREKAIEMLSLEIHQAMQRAFLKMLFNSPLPKDPGELVDKCFDFLNDLKITVAPKMWSMRIIDKVAKKEKDLYSELRLSLEKNLPQATAGFKSAAYKILTKI